MSNSHSVANRRRSTGEFIAFDSVKFAAAGACRLALDSQPCETLPVLPLLNEVLASWWNRVTGAIQLESKGMTVFCSWSSGFFGR